jgi:hypothetical protein
MLLRYDKNSEALQAYVPRWRSDITATSTGRLSMGRGFVKVKRIYYLSIIPLLRKHDMNVKK